MRLACGCGRVGCACGSGRARRLLGLVKFVFRMTTTSTCTARPRRIGRAPPTSVTAACGSRIAGEARRNGCCVTARVDARARAGGTQGHASERVTWMCPRGRSCSSDPRWRCRDGQSGRGIDIYGHDSETGTGARGRSKEEGSFLLSAGSWSFDQRLPGPYDAHEIRGGVAGCRLGGHEAAARSLPSGTSASNCGCRSPDPHMEAAAGDTFAGGVVEHGVGVGQPIAGDDLERFRRAGQAGQVAQVEQAAHR